MMKIGRLLILACGFLALSAFEEQPITETYATTTTITDVLQLQPQDERNAQNSLPMAKDALWATLGKTKIKVDEEKGIYSAEFPDEVKKLNGQTVKISGFILPLESDEKFTHFLLSKRTPTCFFCPPGAPNEIIEVYSVKPIEWVEDLVTYEGKFELTDNQEMGVFYKMSDAIKK